MQEQLTLKQIQMKLGVPQHVLIHLCEKDVINPEFEQTQGRGQWRKFSQKNLFEFTVALELRKYELTVVTTGTIIRFLASFEKAVRKKMKDFRLPNSLIEKKIPLNLYILDGKDLLFEINKKLLGFDLKKAIQGDINNLSVRQISSFPQKYDSYLKIDLVSLAQKSLI